jgi:NAD(P)H-dependent FMN reductase
MSLKIAVIVSTTRPTRVGRKVANWFMDQVQETENVNFELIDLKEINLPFLDEPQSPSTGEYEHEYTKQWSEKIKGFDGFIFVTAEYNNGPPAPLKNALDVIYHEWDRKPVAFVGYGTYGATRAVEQLVNITAKIGMVPLPKTFVGITKSWEAITDQGEVKPEYVMGKIEGLLDNLLWWAQTLKSSKKTN